MADNWQRLKEATGGIVAVTVVMFAASSPLLRYADPTAVFGVGTLAAGAIAFAYFGTAWDNRIIQGLGIASSVLLGAWAAYGFTSTSDGAKVASLANDRRCLAIQRDMLSPEPRRSDSADLFQALGCRPQGQGIVYAPPAAASPAPTGKGFIANPDHRPQEKRSAVRKAGVARATKGKRKDSCDSRS